MTAKDGIYIVWRGRGYWLRDPDGERLLFCDGRKDASYQLRGVGVTPTYDFAAFSLRTGKRVGGIFHRYMVQQRGPHRFPKIPHWFSPDYVRE